MKFPSIKLLVQDTFKVFNRFPLETISALAGTIISTINISLSHQDSNFDGSLYVRLTMLASLSMLLNLSATLFTASKKIKGTKKWVYHIAACVIIFGLFFLLNPYSRGTAHIIRFFLRSQSNACVFLFGAEASRLNREDQFESRCLF